MIKSMNLQVENVVKREICHGPVHVPDQVCVKDLGPNLPQTKHCVSSVICKNYNQNIE